MPIKILLADKSITIQKVVEMLFSGREYEVVCVSDGEAALAEAARSQPDAALVDVDLPRIDGYSFAARLRQTPALMQVPVILMMSRDDVYDSAKGKHVGIFDHIAKPFESQELIGKVKKALSTAPPRPAGPKETGAAAEHKAAPAPAPFVAKPKEAAPADIFDIIKEAPAPIELKQADAADESVFEVEPEVEEISEPAAQESLFALPVGDKALEEMRASLGLSEETEEALIEDVSLEAFELAMETGQSRSEIAPEVAPPSAPASAQREVKPETKARVSAAFESAAKVPAEQPVPTRMRDAAATAPPMPPLPESELRLMAEKAVEQMARQAVEKIPLPKISSSELWEIAEKTILKMAEEVFADLPPMQPPQMPADQVRGMMEEAIAKTVKEAVEKNPPRIPEDQARGMMEEAFAKTAKEALDKMPPAADELRELAERTMVRLAEDAFRDLPPPMPKISDDTIRRGLEQVLSGIAREIAREIAKELVERVVWEVVPQLAEVLIKEEIERLKAVR
jgi:CheY-like chemotaxis protein